MRAHRVSPRRLPQSVGFWLVLLGFGALLVGRSVLGGGDGDPPGGIRTPEPLPSVVVAACPARSELLAEPASGNDVLPALTLPCFGHPGTVELRRLGGRPTVVNLWASWCGPCKEELPILQKAHLALRERVRFLGVDTRDSVRPARETLLVTGVTYPSVVDDDEQLRRALGAGAIGMPLTLFVDARGQIAGRHLGGLTEADLRAALREHLGVTW